MLQLQQICWCVLTNGTNNSVALTGLVTNETIVGIDFRPATGSLYA
jgi:hypothetical protein